jgi:hypothetical protein
LKSWYFGISISAGWYLGHKLSYASYGHCLLLRLHWLFFYHILFSPFSWLVPTCSLLQHPKLQVLSPIHLTFTLISFYRIGKVASDGGVVHRNRRQKWCPGGGDRKTVAGRGHGSESFVLISFFFLPGLDWCYWVIIHFNLTFRRYCRHNIIK